MIDCDKKNNYSLQNKTKKFVYLPALLLFTCLNFRQKKKENDIF